MKDILNQSFPKINEDFQGKIGIIYTSLASFFNHLNSLRNENVLFINRTENPFFALFDKNHRYFLIMEYLQRAKEWLRFDGTFFLSCQDKDLAYMRLLCEQVFGTENYLCTFIIKKRNENRILRKNMNFHETVEYLLFYRKTPIFKPPHREAQTVDFSEYIYEITERTTVPQRMWLGGKEVDLFYPHQYILKKGKADANKLKKITIRGSIKTGNSSGRFFEEHLTAFKHIPNLLFRVKNMGDDVLSCRYFINRKNKNFKNGFYFQGVPCKQADFEGLPYSDFQNFEYAFTYDSYNENGEKYHKPIAFLRWVLNMGNQDETAPVIELFAQDNSFAQAVREENQKKGQKRLCLS